MRRRRSDGATTGEIDISPLIDCVFILLIFFMVTTTFVKDMKLELTRPSASSSTRAAPQSLRVYVDRSGSVFVDDQPVRPWMLQSHVRDALRGQATREVLVIVDQSVPAQQLVEVVDQCRLAGASDVGVATEAEAG